jgi:hypothetical protein
MFIEPKLDYKRRSPPANRTRRKGLVDVSDERTLKCERNGKDMMRKLSLILLTIVGVASAQAGGTHRGGHGTWHLSC